MDTTKKKKDKHLLDNLVKQHDQLEKKYILENFQFIILLQALEVFDFLET